MTAAGFRLETLRISGARRQQRGQRRALRRAAPRGDPRGPAHHPRLPRRRRGGRRRVRERARGPGGALAARPGRAARAERRARPGHAHARPARHAGGGGVRGDGAAAAAARRSSTPATRSAPRSSPPPTASSASAASTSSSWAARRGLGASTARSPAASPSLLGAHPRLRITHQTGALDEAEIRAACGGGCPASCASAGRVTPFIHDVGAAIVAADLVLMRAGGLLARRVRRAGTADDPRPVPVRRRPSALQRRAVRRGRGGAAHPRRGVRPPSASAPSWARSSTTRRRGGRWPRRAAGSAAATPRPGSSSC